MKCSKCLFREVLDAKYHVDGQGKLHHCGRDNPYICCDCNPSCRKWKLKTRERRGKKYAD